MPPLRYFASFFCLHHLRHEAAHRLCGFVLLLPRSVGVGAECESSVIVAEHTADGFDVHPILQCQRCEGVSEVVKSDVRQPGVLQDLLVQIYDGVWVVHLTSYRRGEHVGILGMLAVFRYQQVYGILRDRYFSDRSLRFGTGQRQFAIGIFDILLADGDGFVLCVEVAPEKRRDLALPQARDQFQIEHREQASSVSGLEIVTPAFAHRIIAELAAPYLKAGQTVVLNPGSVFGAIEFLNVLREKGNHEDITVGETSSNIFACRRYRPNDVNILGIKDNMHLACIPADRTERVVRELNAFFPQYIAVPNIIYTSFLDINAFTHPVAMIFCASRVELDEKRFDFYWGSMASVGVCNNIEAIDRERQALAKAIGFEQESINDLIHGYYGHWEWPTLHEFYKNSTIHGGLPESISPPSTRHRYLTEDLPYGLVPISELAKKVGVPTPHIDGLITLCSTFNGEDYYKLGRSLEKLGLADKSLDEIIRFVIEGK